MMFHGHVAHLPPSLDAHANNSRPCPVSSVRFARGSRFALTDAGGAFASRLLDGKSGTIGEGLLGEMSDELRGQLVPRYDREHRQLCWGSHTLKRFRQPAYNQELILTAAEELGWPAWFDDPLPRRTGKSPKALLHDTLKDLNRRQTPYLIHFLGDGTGTRIGWEYR
jgi:hypothetical protein